MYTHVSYHRMTASQSKSDREKKKKKKWTKKIYSLWSCPWSKDIADKMSRKIDYRKENSFLLRVSYWTEGNCRLRFILLLFCHAHPIYNYRRKTNIRSAFSFQLSQLIKKKNFFTEGNMSNFIQLDFYFKSSTTRQCLLFFEIKIIQHTHQGTRIWILSRFISIQENISKTMNTEYSVSSSWKCQCFPLR